VSKVEVMSRSLVIFASALIAILAEPAVADDSVVNTPVVLTSLKGDWELLPPNRVEYKQRLHFGGSACGQWQQTARALPTSITFYIDGNELLLQHYYEPDTPFNYRLKQLRFRYELAGDTLTLTGTDGKTHWKRVPAEQKTDDPELTLRETRVTESQSRFAIQTNSTDAQLGIVVGIRIAKLADERGFRFFTGREVPQGYEVEFFDKRPADGGGGGPPVFDVRLLMPLIDAPEREQSDR
jgi:hypothetical protein